MDEVTVTDADREAAQSYLAKELEALAEKATEGPWKQGPPHVVQKQTIDEAQRRVTSWIAEMCNCPAHPEPEREANAALIVALRNNLPTIIAALSASRPVGEGWRPIESFDRFGQNNAVIVAVTCDGREPIVGEAWRAEDDGEWWWAGTSPGEYADSPISEMNFGRVTHWQPLPEPPRSHAEDSSE